jgi:Nucleotidyl transferase AbiEii toxin, Type IV TA system
VKPKKPEHPNPFAAAFLERLQDRPEAEQFVLGGYFALQHYHDYRQTGDVDAWWLSREDPRALAAAREVFAETAAAFGYSVRERTWGETISLEALNGSNKAFSFQVAVRSVEIDRPVPSPWGRFPIESLEENIASKMVALVARGAPRDFVDIKELVDAGLVAAERCWELWVAKVPNVEIDDARLRVKTHLAQIEARRPIERIPMERRPAATQLRAWYRDEFAAKRPDLARGNVRPDGEERPQ